MRPIISQDGINRREIVEDCRRARHRDLDSELRLVAALRCAAQERGGPLPSIAVADALLEERRELTELGNQLGSVRV